MPLLYKIKHSKCGKYDEYDLSNINLEGTNPRVHCVQCDVNFRVPKKIISEILKESNNNGRRGKNTPSTKNVSNPLSTDFIDDPDELLYSVSIRELNREQPDPRWANILLSCREKIHKTKKQRQEALQNKPTDKLLHMIEKSYGKHSVSDSLPSESLQEE